MAAKGTERGIVPGGVQCAFVRAGMIAFDRTPRFESNPRFRLPFLSFSAAILEPPMPSARCPAPNAAVRTRPVLLPEGLR